MPRRLTTFLTASFLLITSAFVLGCSTKIQSARSYTPAQGVNADNNGVAVRNLVITATTEGKGQLFGAIIAKDSDKLSKISIQTTKSDSSPDKTLSTMAEAIELPAAKLVKLPTSGQAIVEDAALKPGSVASLVLTFDKVGEMRLLVPVLDANHPDYKTAHVTLSASPVTPAQNSSEHTATTLPPSPIPSTTK